MSQVDQDKDKLIAVGIDPGLTCLGIAALVPQHHAPPAKVSQRFESQSWGQQVTDRIGRMVELSSLVCQFIDRWRGWAGAVVVIENYAYGYDRGDDQQRSQLVTAGEIGGILRADILRRELDLKECPPVTLKKFVLGGLKRSRGPDGKLHYPAKVAVANALKARFGVQLNSYDEYDALGLAWLGACIARIAEPQNKQSKEAVQTVLHRPVTRRTPRRAKTKGS